MPVPTRRSSARASPPAAVLIQESLTAVGLAGQRRHMTPRSRVVPSRVVKLSRRRPWATAPPPSPPSPPSRRPRPAREAVLPDQPGWRSVSRSGPDRCRSWWSRASTPSSTWPSPLRWGPTTTWSSRSTCEMLRVTTAAVGRAEERSVASSAHRCSGGRRPPRPGRHAVWVVDSAGSGRRSRSSACCACSSNGRDASSRRGLVQEVWGRAAGGPGGHPRRPPQAPAGQARRRRGGQQPDHDLPKAGLPLRDRRAWLIGRATPVHPPKRTPAMQVTVTKPAASRAASVPPSEAPAPAPSAWRTSTPA